MKLEQEQLESIACGATHFVKENGFFRWYRFTDEEQDFFKTYKSGYFFKRTLCAAGVKLAFYTDSKSLALKGVASFGTGRTYYAIDVVCNDERVGSICNFSNIEGQMYTDKTFDLGAFEKAFSLGEGKKKIEIYMPFSVVIDWEEISLDDGAFVAPLPSKNVSLLYGDSITQGYDCLHTSNHYAVKLSKFLEVDFVNKAIGGEIFNPGLAKLKNDVTPRYIVVAYGTNDWGNGLGLEEFSKNCKDFYLALRKNYPDAKILALSPIWRKEILTEKRTVDFDLIGKTISNVVSEIENAFFIDGFDLVPHEEKYFADIGLHPNDEGFEYYANRFIRKIAATLG